MRELLTVGLLFVNLTVFGQDPVFTQAHLEEARVYYNGADLTQKTEASLPEGSSELVITNIADRINESTLQIGAVENLTIMSFQYTDEYMEEYDNAENSPLTKALRDSIDVLQKRYVALENLIETDERSIDLMESDMKDEESLGKTLTLSTTAEMEKWVDFYHTKRQELKNHIYEKTKEREALKKRIDALHAQLKLGTDQSQKYGKGKLIVQVMAPQAGSFHFKINYVTPNAQWTPGYDLRIEKMGAPIQMTYKAQIVQTTGIDWKKVNLSLTSHSLTPHKNIPEWENMFIDYAKERPQPLAAPQRDALQGQLDEVVLQSRVAKKASDMEYEPEYKESTVADYTEIKESQLNTTFDISLPYTILSNGKKHGVDLNTFSLEGDYHYYSAPKMDKTVYLVAEVKDYQKHSLLSGDANILFDGMNIGKTFLTAENTEDKLRLNLGNDPQINISRTLMKEESGTKTLSSRTEQDFVYEIKVKNDKNRKVDLVVEDQFPISKDKSLEVSLKETSGAEVDEEKGLLKWKISLEAGETKTLKMGYQIRYRKGERVTGL